MGVEIVLNSLSLCFFSVCPLKCHIVSDVFGIAQHTEAAHLTANFFESGVMPVSILSRNQTVLGLGVQLVLNGHTLAVFAFCPYCLATMATHT